MKPEEKARIFDEGLAKLYPDAECSLEYKGDPWRLLVMARLSAQCTDERVNAVCRELFERFPDARSMADAPLEEIEELVRKGGQAPLSPPRERPPWSAHRENARTAPGRPR